VYREVVFLIHKGCCVFHAIHKVFLLTVFAPLAFSPPSIAFSILVIILLNGYIIDFCGIELHLSICIADGNQIV